MHCFIEWGQPQHPTAPRPLPLGAGPERDGVRSSALPPEPQRCEALAGTGPEGTVARVGCPSDKAWLRGDTSLLLPCPGATCHHGGIKKFRFAVVSTGPLSVAAQAGLRGPAREQAGPGAACSPVPRPRGLLRAARRSPSLSLRAALLSLRMPGGRTSSWLFFCCVISWDTGI